MDCNWQTTPFDTLSPQALYAILRLRQEVFVVEQDCVYLDLDGRDQQAQHMLCSRGGDLVAYQRCLPPGLGYTESSLGRVVVHPAARGLQLGRELVQRGIDHNLRAWPGNDICISAQAHLQTFYSSAGFAGEGEEYMEDGIPHRRMRYSAS